MRLPRSADRCWPRALIVVSTLVAAWSVGVSSEGTVGQSSATQERPRFATNRELVEVPVSVVDDHGAFVSDLEAGDIELLERGQRQEIAIFQRVTSPGASEPAARSSRPPSDVAANDFPPDGRAFVLILDDIHIDSRRTAATKALVRQFIERHLQPSDLVAVAWTSGQRGLTSDFTTDHGRILALVDQFTGLRPPGGAFLDALNDARSVTDMLARAATELAEERRRRIAIVWLTEGIDYNIYNTQDPKANDVTRAMDRAIQELRKSNITLYAIDPRHLASTEGQALETFTPPTEPDSPWADPTLTRARRGGTSLTMPNDRERLVLSLQSLMHMSEATGGFALLNSNDYDRRLAGIAAAAGNYYLLGYYPSEEGRQGEFRGVTVKVRRPGVRVFARTGYIARRSAAAEHRPAEHHATKGL